MRPTHVGDRKLQRSGVAEAGLSWSWVAQICALFALPALHPLLMPAVGVPSHLLWWVHVLPVALITFRRGRMWSAASVGASALLVVVGELAFGSGYGVAAPFSTVVALATALTATNLLVVGFALYARRAVTRYRLLFSGIRMPILQVNAEGMIRGLNPAAAELLGVDPHEALGHPFEGVVSLPDVSSLRDLEQLGGWRGLAQVGIGTAPRSVHVVIVAVREAETGNYQVMLADRSTEVMQEQELERQVRLSTLGEALAGVAHELNNPLAVILGNLELLGLGVFDATETRDTLDVLRHEAERMKSIVRELVSYSRQDSEVECVPIDELLMRLARVQRITLGRRVPIELDLRAAAHVEASPNRIEQIVLNLISNAAYAIRSGGGTRITLRTRSDDAHVTIEVIDDGPGIDPHVAERIFDAFVTTKPKGEGTGLGLAISRRLARAAGGDLQARRVGPRGAGFVLSLPVAAPPLQTADDEGRGTPSLPQRLLS